jgi:SAM-dependent methyltransferase
VADYALLIRPSSNRVYADSATALARAELALFSRTVLGSPLTDLAQRLIGGVPYVTFSADELTAADVAFLANVSSIYALFRIQADGTTFEPVPLAPIETFDDDLVTIQKYPGKTNEQFTKLLINVTLLSSAFAPELGRGRLALLDPLCGRGTTLNQALMYGWDASGVEIDGKSVEAYSAFLRTWLQRKRIKHRSTYDPVRRDRQVVARRLSVTLAAAKDDYKADVTQQLEVVCADSVRAAEFFRAQTFHLVVADLPYGVQHGSRTGNGLARKPLDLLAAAAPAWTRLLRPGGALGISWNTFVASRAAAARPLADAGLEVLDDSAYRQFSHRVDQAINRDILVARKPTP